MTDTAVVAVLLTTAVEIFTAVASYYK